MNKSLETFMSMAFTAIVLSSLLFAVVYMSLQDKNDHHRDVLKSQYQLELKH